ncbi:unnamed protein product [Linum trigynum]|uniref:Uncharacterized protein n=1 Tax=Linum trigynum TaxID=586398 RepID=A0AAV2DDL5_9ROSI
MISDGRPGMLMTIETPIAVFSIAMQRGRPRRSIEKHLKRSFNLLEQPRMVNLSVLESGDRRDDGTHLRIH